jgi:hypothetical protein
VVALCDPSKQRAEVDLRVNACAHAQTGTVMTVMTVMSGGKPRGPLKGSHMCDHDH